MDLFRVVLAVSLGVAAFLIVYWAFSGSTLIAFIAALLGAVWGFRDHEKWRSPDGLGGMRRSESS